MRNLPRIILLTLTCFSFLFFITITNPSADTFDDGGDVPFLTADKGAVEDGVFATSTSQFGLTSVLGSDSYGFSGFANGVIIDSVYVRYKTRYLGSLGDAKLTGINISSLANFGTLFLLIPYTEDVPTSLIWQEKGYSLADFNIQTPIPINVKASEWGFSLTYINSSDELTVIQVDAMSMSFVYHNLGGRTKRILH